MKTRDLPVFPLSADPIRSDVARDVQAVRLDIDPVGPENGPRIGLVTLGCDKNTVDSEKIMAALVGHGARVSSDVEGSDVVVVNTCGFIEAAKEQSIETILEACQLKEEGQVKAVVAVGCMVQRYKDELQAEMPEVDLFLGLTEMGLLVPELRQRGLLLEEPEVVPNMERPLRVLSAETPHTSFLKISEGCDHTCAFCAITSFRGLHRSAPLMELVAEAQALSRQGVKELNIISQDTTWYGRDLWRKDRSSPLLPGLLWALVHDTDIAWYRLFYMYPSGITQELVELVATEDALLPYLDMPLQHGSDRMLEAMRRPERQDVIRERVAWLRDAIPDLTLRTTVIVGFPGETDDDFRDMLDLLEEVRFDQCGGVHVFRRGWHTRRRHARSGTRIAHEGKTRRGDGPSTHDLRGTECRARGSADPGVGRRSRRRSGSLGRGRRRQTRRCRPHGGAGDRCGRRHTPVPGPGSDSR